MVSLLCAVFSAIQVAISTHLVIYLVEVKSFSPIKAGTYLLLLNVAGTIGRIAWGVISDRAFKGQRRPVLMVVGVIIALLAVIIAVSGDTMMDWLLYVLIFFLGFTANGWAGVYFAAASEMSCDRLVASGIGWSLTITTLGAMAGPLVFGRLVDTTSSYDTAWMIFGAVSAASILLLLPIRERSFIGDGSSKAGIP